MLLTTSPIQHFLSYTVARTPLHHSKELPYTVARTPLHHSKELPKLRNCCHKILLTCFHLLILILLLYPKILVSLESIISPLAFLMQCICRMPCRASEATKCAIQYHRECIPLFCHILSNVNHTHSLWALTQFHTPCCMLP